MLQNFPACYVRLLEGFPHKKSITHSPWSSAKALDLGHSVIVVFVHHRFGAILQHRGGPAKTHQNRDIFFLWDGCTRTKFGVLQGSYNWVFQVVQPPV